ncbi:hypothetical protein [Aquabacterium sp.]|uniref:hypothetical protein n=1 Tax=Aquabacterium sp. TaxID=1872578 RepID=UPI0026033BF4|nr:hypothetical protein [Aquabacterium sp.]MDD2978127.1 hypothetical protein [Aquabacterium sp.]
MSTETQPKPLPLRVGVSGFNAFAAKPGLSGDSAAPDWVRLEALPAFQMYLTEKRLEARRSLDFFDAYCQWHGAKGYWPNETPTGELINGD